ncbi:TRAP transporter small permease [Acuticoccus kandeliae]|uniref:TRAP transporter small permease n=1 Tax=Acuticoccus kandeliae TaxID=2073160 RepID=UPI000D3E3EEE|nr:TRAP transporter small permease [Acuticoccus kandeliae]
MVFIPSGPGDVPEGPRESRAILWLVRVLEWVVMLLMGVIATFVIIEVGLRWLGGGSSLIITDELTRYLMIWTAMLGAALLVYEDGHIRIGILPDLLPPRAALVCVVLSQCVALFFLLVLVWVSLVNLPETTGQQTITLGVSMAWFAASLPVGGALMALLLVYEMVQTVRGRRGRLVPAQ